MECLWEPLEGKIQSQSKMSIFKLLIDHQEGHKMDVYQGHLKSKTYMESGGKKYVMQDQVSDRVQSRIL